MILAHVMKLFGAYKDELILATEGTEPDTNS